MKKSVSQEEILLIDKIVLDSYDKHKNDKSWIVEDGIIDINSYNSAKYRILWILKEVHEVDDEDDDSMFGDWDLREALNKLINDKAGLKGWSRTLTPMIYTTYGILNNCLWNDMDYIKDDRTMIDVIRNIAYINIKKQPGRSVAIHDQLSAFYLKDKDVILSQINGFNPDIIIFGRTLDFLRDDLGLLEKNSKQSGHVKYYLQNRKIYAGAYHPANRRSQIEYCDDIINAVNAWKIETESR